MAHYKVIVTKTIKKEIFVDAENCKSAVKIAKMKIEDNEIWSDAKAKLLFTAEYDYGIENELEVSHYGMGSTVKLMNRFDKRKGNTYKYSRLVLKHYMIADCADCKNAWVSLLIDRISYKAKTFGDVTFTELKRDYCSELREYIKSYICSKGDMANVGEQIIFDVPYHLRAQRSVDRMPGGWEYGTLYGETSDYGIIGIRLEK